MPCYQSYKHGHIDAHCLTHARRRFVEGQEEDMDYCKEMVGYIGKVYKVDARGRELMDDDRMELHKAESLSSMESLLSSAQGALDDNRFLPNSELGKATKYITENHDKLSVFMDIPGVPLDTNTVERKIKAPIRIRKQAPIFKTLELSLIHI